MASIEDRIVKIQFDNAAFESKLSATITSIEKLNTTLANAGSRNGLENINTAARNFNLNGMHTAIDGISAKFLAMSTIAITVLSSIVAKAFDAGLQIVKALSLDPVIAGFQEYELQIGSIQTILANTSADGTNLEQVNAALDELNTYSDKTIYNFGQMTRNIGTFTAAGVDLDTSVQSIKGIANLAAISGSSSEQASTAMYQLSQAIASGSVKLMDWNSVVNAGMGGEIFQKALFETGKTMGTIADVPMDMTFEEWTAAGNTFRGSLEDGWLTADVLTTTLQGFTGEMTEAELMAQGFSQTQAQEIMRLGQLGVDAATKVRTFTQLLNTSKEALQSGWAQTFEIIFGDFEEATELFTGISDAIGGMIGRSADARNAMLQDWKDLGGREVLITGLKNAFKALGAVFKPIQEAFRYIFPPMTGERLFEITRQFNHLMLALMPAPQTVDSIRRIFTGLFAALEIGWTVIKEGVKFIAGLVQSLTGLGSGNFLSSFAKIGDFFTQLNRDLVGGGGIANFFDNLSISLEKPIAVIKELKDAFLGLFDNLQLPAGFGDVFEGLGGIFGGLATAGSNAAGGLGGIWEPLKTAIGAVGDILEEAWDTLVEFFGNLGSSLADAMGVPDFSGLLEILDTALLGGIVALLYKFSSGGLFSSFGGGIFGSISGAFGELTGTLKAMQMDLKAEALLKIAAAIGILAVSLLILSTIDSEKLSESLAALAIAFGQLMGAFAILNKLGVSLTGAGTFVLIATGMVIMAGAVLLLTASIKLLSMLSWEELAKGLVGVAGALGILVGAVLLLNFAKGSIIGAGIGMMFMAASLVIMAAAVKLFSMMNWGEMAKGLAGVAGALLVLAVASKFMGPNLLLIGPGLIAVAIALNIIAGAMKIMATLGWEEIGKGLVAMGGALAVIAATTSFMSPMLPLIGVGLIAVGAGLTTIAGVMKLLGTMSWEEIAKGLVGITGALLGISAAMVVANSGVLGAGALIAMSFGLTILVGVLTTMSALSWGEIVKGVGGIVIALAALAGISLLLSSAVLPMLGFGLALTLLGAGFALFGVGVMSVAKGLEILVKVGPKALEALVDAVEAFGNALPELLADVGEGILELVDTLLEGMPEIIDGLVEVLSGILDGLIELIPKAGEVIRSLLDEVIKIIREYFPQLVDTGFEMIVSLLTGIRDNIGPIATLASEIIINFMDALAVQVPAMIDSFFNLLVAVIDGVIAKLGELGDKLAPIGMKLLNGLLEGVKEALPGIGAWFRELPGKILGFLGDVGSWLLDKGIQLLTGLKNGAVEGWNTVKDWFAGIPDALKGFFGNAIELLKTIGTNVINGLYNGAIAGWNGVKAWFKGLPDALKAFFGTALELLKTIGKNIINGLYNGAIAGWNSVKGWFKGLPDAIKAFFGNALELLKTIGKNIINGLYNGAIAAWNGVKGWFDGIPEAIKNFFTGALDLLKTIGGNIINGLYNGAIGAWNNIKGWFGGIPQAVRTAIGGLRDLLTDIGGNIMRSLKNGAANVFEEVKNWFVNKAKAIRDAVLNFFGIGSPSKVFMEIGGYVMEGLRVGLEDEWDTVARWLHQVNPVDEMQQNLASKMNAVVAGMASQLEEMDEFQPVITPVLDLTRVQEDARALAGMLPATESYSQAAGIARSNASGSNGDSITTPGTGNVSFEQNIYAPAQLSAGDIYRQTRNQISIAKEELKIP